MRIAVDTNILLRFLLADDPDQHSIASRLLEEAEAVIVPMVALCEAVWVLSRTYRLSRAEIAEMIRALVEAETIECDMDLVQTGLATLEAGGDFADGVIARQGQFKRADVFVSFDRKAVRQMNRIGIEARTPA